MYAYVMVHYSSAFSEYSNVNEKNPIKKIVDPDPTFVGFRSWFWIEPQKRKSCLLNWVNIFFIYLGGFFVSENWFLLKMPTLKNLMSINEKLE